MQDYGLTRRQTQEENDQDGDQQAHSESGHYTKVVKRRNFLTLWQDEYQADKFVSTHLYGAINNLSIDVPQSEIEDALNTSAQNLS